MGNDSARDPKRTKRADVLDEVKPRLSWGRSKTRGELEDTTWVALLSQKPGCARRGHYPEGSLPRRVITPKGHSEQPNGRLEEHPLFLASEGDQKN